MATIAQVSEVLQDLFTRTAERVAQEQGLVQRRRKVSGATLSQTLVLGWLNKPEATLEELAQTAASVGLDISPQGLEQRFTPQAAAFLQALLGCALESGLSGEAVGTSLLARFEAVHISDSTIVSLPDCLKEIWPGFGGRVATSEAAVKLQVRWEMRRGRLEGPYLVPARVHDRDASQCHPPLPAGALHLADQGYWKLTELANLSAGGCYWLCRLHVQVALFDGQGDRWNQVAWVATQSGDCFDQDVQLGVGQRLPARLLGFRVPDRVAAERRRRLKEQARSRGQTVSPLRLALADWTLLVTNVPRHLLAAEEALVLARLRWQVELLFKLWKSVGRIDQWCSRKPWRILCELYAKLLAMVIQHWLFLPTHWSSPDRSLVKAAKTVQRHAVTLAVSLRNHARLREAVELIATCISRGCRINKSRVSPRTYQLLQSPIGGLT